MGFFAPDLGIDLGTSNTMVYVRGRGVVISEPTIVVTDANNRRNIRAVGDEARYLMGRTTPNLTAVMPMRGGSIDNPEATYGLLRYFIRKAIGVNYVVRPKVLIAVPCALSEVARKAVTEACKLAGAKQVYLIEKPFAAALGTQLPIYEAMGTMVMDIGGGTTDAAILSLGGLVVAKSANVGGAKMDEAIAGYMKTQNMIISARTAEDLKIDLGSAVESSAIRRVKVRGKEESRNAARDIEFTSAQCYEALKEPCYAILQTAKWVLKRTPPEMASDIMRSGIHLTGGASQLYGLDTYLAEHLKIPVLLATEPMDCTIMGLGYLVENMGQLSSLHRAMGTD